jgi:hypothetical protein
MVFMLFLFCVPPTEAKDLNVLFIGDNGHHRPQARFDQLQPVLAARGIKLVYTLKVSDLNPENLKQYDAVALYANIDSIDPKPEKAFPVPAMTAKRKDVKPFEYIDVGSKIPN